MITLRNGAALVHLVPSLRLRLHAANRVVADIARPPFTDDEAPQIPACLFHRAVAGAHARRSLGEQLRFMTVPDGVDPIVELGVPPGDLVLPGGIVRITLGPTRMHLVPVARPLDQCLAVLGGLGLHGLGCHYDPDVDITILHTPSPHGNDGRSAEALDRLERAAAACAVADLEDYLRAVVTDPIDRTWSSRLEVPDVAGD